MDLESNGVTAELGEVQPAPSVARGFTPLELSRSVAEALAEVFDRTGPPSRGQDWIALNEAVRSVRPQPKRKAAVVKPIAAGIALALVGLAGGAYLSRQPAGQHPPLALSTTLQAPPTSAQPVDLAPPPSPATAPPAPLPPVPAPPVSAAPPPAPAPPLRPSLARAVPEPAETPVPHRAETAGKLKGLVAACNGRGACDSHTVEDADKMVADAYAKAARSGAANPTLADLRRRLENLRSDGADSPQILVGNYALLAHDLDRFADASQPAAGRARHGGSRQASAEQEDRPHRPQP